MQDNSAVDENSSSIPASIPAANPICQPIAAYWHTILLLTLQALLAYRGQLRLLHSQGMTHLQRVALYERTIVIEWSILALVVAGVWLHKAPLSAVLGPQWSSLRGLFFDFGIGFAFLVVTVLITSLLGHDKNRATVSFLPKNKAEFFFWMAVAVSAGICEEAVFRGYLQRQFIAITRSAAAGIVLSAVVFGAAHFYQGPRRALQIAVLGALAGILAYWRGSVRPGMIAHVFQDVLGGLIHN